MLQEDRVQLFNDVGDILPEWAPMSRTILCGLRGSDAHGTKLEDKGPNDIDDIDVFTITVQPIEFYLGLRGYHNKNEHWDSAGEDLDVLVYDIRKFMDLAAKCNPNVINWLWNRDEDYLLIDSFGQRLIDERMMFLSKEVFKRLHGYAYSQMKRMKAPDKKYEGYMGEKRKRLVDEFGFDLKNAAHCVRLLSMGIEVADTGVISTYRPEDEQILIKDIKRGIYSLEEISEMIEDLSDEFHEVEKISDLPDRVDRDKVSDLLVEIIQTF